MAHGPNRFREPGFSEGIQLVVKYIPLEFEEDFLIGLFSAYGDILDFHIPESAYLQGEDYIFGFVTFATYSDAVSAMQALNGSPPHYLSVELSKLCLEMLRKQTRVFGHLKYRSSNCFVEQPTNFRRHSSMGVNYTLTSSPDGKRTIQGVVGGEPRRSVPFRGTSHLLAGNPFEEEDIPAPGQKQKFPCYKCGNLTFRRCVCGGAYYCKEACRMNDWPEHKQECIKKLESRPEFKAETFAGSQNRNANDIDQTNNHIKTENYNMADQMENAMQSEQKVNCGNSLGQRQRRFPALNDFDGPQRENFGAKSDGNKQPKFLVRNEVGGLQSERYVDKKECSHNQNINNGGSKNDHIDYDSGKSKGRKNYNWGDCDASKCVGRENQTKGFDGTDASFDMWKRRNEIFGKKSLGGKSNYILQGSDAENNFNQHDGKNEGSYNDQEGENQKKFNHDGENRMDFSRQDVEEKRNFNQQDQRNVENRRNFDQLGGENRRNFHRDGENRKNFNQRDGENRRNWNQRDGDKERNFNRDVENQRNFKQRDGDTGRNINQRDGENQIQQSGGNRRNLNQRDGNTKNFNDPDGDKIKFGDKGGSLNDRLRKNFGSRDHKSSCGGMNERRGTAWTSRYPREVLQTKCDESKESWDEQTEVKIEVKQDIPEENLDKVMTIPQVKLEKKDDALTVEVNKTPFSVVHASVEVPAKVEKVLVVMEGGPKTFFVQKLANNETLQLICEKVRECPTLPLVKPEVGMLCGAMFEGEWYRARVLMLAPELALQYIDYGNIDVCDPATLHALPDSIVNYPPMAEKIEIIDEMPEIKSLYGAVISLKSTGETENGVEKFVIDNGKSETVLEQAVSITPRADATVEVVQQISPVSFQVEGALLVTKEFPPVNALPNASLLCSKTVPPVASAVPPPVASAVPPPVASAVPPPVASAVPGESTLSDAVKVVVIMSEGPKIYFVHHLANNDILKKICTEVVKSPFMPVVKPEVGMLCAAMFEGEWYRARVLMLAPQISVQYIDYGNIDICDPATLHALPDSIVNYPPLAEKVEFVNETSILPDGSVVMMKPTGEVEKGVLKVMLDDGKNLVCPKQVYSALSSEVDMTSKTQNGVEKFVIDNGKSEAVLAQAVSVTPRADATVEVVQVQVQQISPVSFQVEEAPLVTKESPPVNALPDASLSCSKTVPPVASAVPPVASAVPPVASAVPPVASAVLPVASAVPEESTMSDAVKVVVIMSEAPKIYFVHRLANNDTLKKICTEVVKSPFMPVVKPEVGMLCAAMFEGEWYRARVLMLAPQISVQYIDYGNTDICDPATLHALPDSIVNYPPLAEKVEFVNESSILPDGSVVSMKPTGEVNYGVLKAMLDDGKNLVCPKQVYSAISSQVDITAKSQQTSATSLEAEGSLDLCMSSDVINSIGTSKQVVISTPVVALKIESRPTVASRLQAQSLSSSVDDFPKEFAKAKITVRNDRNDYWVTWERDSEMVEKIILKTHEHMSSTPLANPRVALLCAARFEGIWFRARITKVLPEVEVLYIDYGNSEICPIDDLRELPEPVKDFPSMAFRVKLTEGTPEEYLDLTQDDYLSLRIVGKDDAEVCTAQVEGVKYPSVVGAETQAAKVNMAVSPSMQENKIDVPVKANKQVEETSVNSYDPALPSDSAAKMATSKINATKFYDVKVAVGLGGNEYWVQRVNRENQLQFVLVEVNDHASKGIRIIPEVGKLCATQFQSFWYRARITKVTPKVEVHFIDYGNTEMCESDILELPESVADIPPLALRIRLADGTPGKFSNLPVDSVISVKPVMKAADNVSIVYVEGVQYAADTINQTSQVIVANAAGASEKRLRDPVCSKPDFQNTCLKFLTAEGNCGGALHFMKKYSDHYYTVTVVTDACRSMYDKLIELRRSGPKLPLDSSFKPVVGDVVLALSSSQGGMCRARVVSQSGDSYRVVLVDCGIVEDATIICELPSSVAYLPAFAVKCLITGYVSEAEFLSKCAKNEDAFIFQVSSVKNDQVMCLVLSITNKTLCTAALSAWEPGLHEIGITHVALRHGDPVRMSLYSGPEKVFITSLVPEHVQQFATFSETLHAYCNQAGYLQQPPQVGDILACKFIVDNKFYRCQIQSVSGKFCNIFYIDYGNSEYGVMYDKLKYISDDLKKFPCHCLQIRLKGIGSCKMTFRLTEFIRKLIDERIMLKMKRHIDGVILYTENSVSVNEEIVHILDSNVTLEAMSAMPSDSSGRIKSFGNVHNKSPAELPSTAPKSSAGEHGLQHLKAADLSNRIFSSALKHREFPPGELQIFVHFILKDLSFMARPCDPAAVKATENLTNSLNVYCSGLPTDSYYPQVDEVCITKLHDDEQWYRAVCLIANPSTGTRKVMFVDYGNVEDVDVVHIRKMEPKFMELPVLVEKYNIKGVDTGNKQVERIVREIIVADKMYTAKIIKHLPTHYMIEIPLVTAALQAEGIFV